MTVWVWLQGVKKTPPPDVEEELMMEALCLLKDEEEGGLLPLPIFLFIVKSVAH